jgi:hypothetical protein
MSSVHFGREWVMITKGRCYDNAALYDIECVCGYDSLALAEEEYAWPDSESI